MKIPSDPAEREALYDRVIEQCEKSQDRRAADYERRRSFYLAGTDNPDESPINKIYPHLDTVTSFLYAPDTTKFSVIPDEGEAEPETYRAPVFSRGINQGWDKDCCDKVVANAIAWALVYNSTILKQIPQLCSDNDEEGGQEDEEKKERYKINPYMIHPASFGVYREDVATLEHQEAMVQTYYITEDALRRKLELAGHPQIEQILAAVTPATKREEQPETSNFSKIVMGSWQPVGNPTAAAGNLDLDFDAGSGYRPEENDNIRALKELWIWDDDLKDYRVVTRPENGGFSIFDLHNFYLPGEHPFVQICPRPLPFYFWGESEVEGLIPLQTWRNEYISWFRATLEKHLNPPTILSGLGMIDEKQYATMFPGSYISDKGVNPGVPPKAEELRPTLPNDMYRMLGEIDNAFNEYSGLPNIVQGKGEVGVRSGRQTDSLARLGSARIRKRALGIEVSLDRFAFIRGKLMQKHDTTKYTDTKGNVFILEQFTKNYQVKVDAHSNSPVFIEDRRDLMFALLDKGCVTKPTMLELIDPPEKERLVREAKEIQANESAAAEEARKTELEKEALRNAPEGMVAKILARLFGQG